MIYSVKSMNIACQSGSTLPRFAEDFCFPFFVAWLNAVVVWHFGVSGFDQEYPDPP